MPSMLMRRRLGGQQYVTLPKNLQSTQHTLHEDFETLGDWSANDAVLGADTTNFKTGTQSLKLTTSAGLEGKATKSGMHMNMTGAASWRLFFYVPDRTKILNVQLRIASGATAALDYLLIIWTQAVIQNGWNCMNVIYSDFTVSGTPDLSDMKIIHLRCYPQAGETAVISYDSFTAGVLGTPAILFAFDDLYASQYTVAFPNMQPHNMRGTAYAITDRIGWGGLLTANQLQVMNSVGWDIANHTQTHTANLDTLSEAEQEAELVGATNALNVLGLTRASRHVAYPGGAWNADTLTAMANLGMLTGRGTNDYKNEKLPPGHNFYLMTLAYLHNTRSLNQAKSYFDTAKTRGEIVVYVLHDLVTTPEGDSEWPIADFQALTLYLAAGGVQCITVSDFYNLQSSAIRVPLIR